MSIPAQTVVRVNPGVISSGGNAIVLNGLILTNDKAVPIGAVQPFPSAIAVGNFFGPLSPEKTLADIYFAGRDNATQVPAQLYFAQYASLAVSAYLRGGSVSAMTLAQLQALTGILTAIVDGVSKTSSAINLSGATSFSNAATLIQAAFTTPGFTVTYDAQRAAFLFTSNTTGVPSTIAFISGTLAAGLMLTQATGAVLSQGAAVSVPGTAMDGVVAVTRNWAAFMTAFEPVLADKTLFSVWSNAQNKRFAYVGWDSDITATQANNTTSWGVLAKAAAYDGVMAIYGTASHAAFVLGVTASIDFTRREGRITYAFKALSGLAASVTDETIAANLKANGYNFYGQFANANNQWTWFSDGNVPGKYTFFDEFVNQIWLNAQLQTANITLLLAMNSIPYNAEGYALVNAACNDPIQAAITFGAIRKGVPLSSQQAAQVNAAAGLDIANALSSNGFYLQILPASAQVRGQRGSPPMTLWYNDGGSIQQITLASIVIQ